MLCPTQLPLFEPKARNTGRLTVQSGRYRERFFAIEFVYGIPPRFRTPHHVPFVHFVVNREVDTGQGGGPPPQAHPATIAGLRGRLLPPDRKFPEYFDNHWRFFWQDTQGHRYVFTLHDLGDDTMELFDALVGGLRPAS